MLALSSVSSNSGILVRRWIERLVAVLTHEKKHNGVGPAICNQQGYVLYQSDLNQELWIYLIETQSS